MYICIYICHVALDQNVRLRDLVIISVMPKKIVQVFIFDNDAQKSK